MNIDFKEIKNNIVTYSPKIGIFVCIFILFIFIAKYVRNKVLSMLTKINGKDESKKNIILYTLISNILYYFILLVGIVATLSFVGFDTSSLLIVFGSIGFALAFACQETISKVISGMLIIIFNYFEIGDLVEIKGTKSYVHSFNLLNTVLIDQKLTKTVIPNNIITSENFNNLFSKKEIKIEFTVAISNKQKVDYTKLTKNIETMLTKKSKFMIPNKKDDNNAEVVIEDVSGASTIFKVNLLINSKDYEDAMDNTKLLVRSYLNDKNIKLYDKY
jgi:small conductance mechanosensitive channel